MRARCVLWGGISLGLGTLGYALCSSSSVGCSTNVVVLTRAAVTARGCAMFSVVAHVGIGLMILGAVLLLGSFVLSVRTRRQVADAASLAEVADGESAPAVTTSVPSASAVVEPSVSVPVAPEPVVVEQPVQPRRERLTPERVGPIPPGADRAESPVPALLPPGWYGNPNNPDRPVQWWDGTRLTDRPSRSGR